MITLQCVSSSGDDLVYEIWVPASDRCPAKGDWCSLDITSARAAGWDHIWIMGYAFSIVRKQ
jgi:hypothetical protein